uniref:Uncharacterized protein n=1 Tax=viral metagenome TaxID=1070528 RepID=A0A6M3KZH7_9ZZZZ
MNLREVTEAIGANGIIIALDCGVHRNCDINSNCPLAVELRKVINESGLTLAQLLEGFASSQEAPPEYQEPQLPEFNGVAEITIAGRTVPVDFTDTIRQQMGRAYDDKLHQFQRDGARAREIGLALYRSYLDQIRSLRNTRTLPQLQFSKRELISTGCLVTVNDGNTAYELMFPLLYNPEYAVHDGIRYQMAIKDIIDCKRDVWVVFTITKEEKITRTVLINQSGRKFEHYHGSGWDCWGTVRIPERWDGRLTSLHNLVLQLRGILATVNMDSILNSTPEGMPTSRGMFERVTVMGKEGEISKPEVVVESTPAQPRRWGQGR